MSEPSITLRVVDLFAEPAFTELVDSILHDRDRRRIGELCFGPPTAAPAKSGAHQVRVGAFAGETLVGWSHAWLQPAGVLYAANSGVVATWRRRGIYTQLVEAVEQEARKLGCLRVESHHRAANHAVLIAKMTAGYTIVGTEYTAEMGLLVKLCKYLDERRHAVFQARAGILEDAVRLFGGQVRPRQEPGA